MNVSQNLGEKSILPKMNSISITAILTKIKDGSQTSQEEVLRMAEVNRWSRMARNQTQMLKNLSAQYKCAVYGC